MKKILAATAIAVIALGAVAYATPWYALHQMKTALAERDAEALASQVDFPALRENIKRQINGAMADSIEAAAGAENPFAAIGQAFASSMSGKIVDAMVSPAGVVALVNKSVVSSEGGTRGDAAQPAASKDSKPRYTAAYAGWDSFVIRPASNPEDGGGLVLRRHGLWSWKLSGIELSTAMAAR
ncbi:DUF2939 domain-containing protein [Janthinobacterium psychrotolerans]|uniref:DUF2939 domain-containing protein n=1 Tax=Janthinobacterium psychrotolerans TaxID=1747903 RepID=UPI0008067848|nr:DUF2939 domain-containing protein [Janthinobacterium psychrotolerans]